MNLHDEVVILKYYLFPHPPPCAICQLIKSIPVLSTLKWQGGKIEKWNPDQHQEKCFPSPEENTTLKIRLILISLKWQRKK